ncbi:hypothetical protein Vafri_1989, partial [Volvox africanus]
VGAASPSPDAAASRVRFALLRRSESSNHVRAVGVMADEPCGRVKSAVWSTRRSSTGSLVRTYGSAAAPPGSLSVTAAAAAAAAAAVEAVTAEAAQSSPPQRHATLSSFLHHFSGGRRRSAQSHMPYRVSAMVPSLLMAKTGATATATASSGGQAPIPLAENLDSEGLAAQPDLACNDQRRDDAVQRLVDGSTGQRRPLQDSEGGGGGGSDSMLWPSHDIITSRRLTPALGPAKLPSPPPPPPSQQQQQAKEQASAAATPTSAVGGLAAPWTSEGGNGHRYRWPLRSPVSIWSGFPQRLANPPEVAVTTVTTATATPVLVSSCSGMTLTGPLSNGHKGELVNLPRSTDGGLAGFSGGITLSLGTRSLRRNPVPDTGSRDVNGASNGGGNSDNGSPECNCDADNGGVAYHHHQHQRQHQHQHHYLHHHKYNHNDRNHNHHNCRGLTNALFLGRIRPSRSGVAVEMASACAGSSADVRPADAPMSSSRLHHPAQQSHAASPVTSVALRSDAGDCDDGDGEARTAPDDLQLQTSMSQVASPAAESSPAIGSGEDAGRSRPMQLGPHRRTRGGGGGSGGGGGGGGSSISASGSGSGVEEVVRTVPRGPSLLSTTPITPQPAPPCHDSVPMSCCRAALSVAESSSAALTPCRLSPQANQGDDQLEDALRLWHGATAAAAVAAAAAPPASKVTAQAYGPAGSVAAAAAAVTAVVTEGDVSQGRAGGGDVAGSPMLVFARVAPPLSECPQAPEVLGELQASVVRLTLVESDDPRVAASLGCGLYLCSLETTSLLGLSGASIESSSRPRTSETRVKEVSEPSVHRRVVEAAGKVLLPLQLPLRRWLPGRGDSAPFRAAEDI